MRPSERAVVGDREADIVLRDGSTAHVRAVRAEDAEAIRSLFAGLSEQSQYLRFFTVAPSLDQVVKWATAAANNLRFGLVPPSAATIMWSPTPPTRATTPTPTGRRSR